MPLLMKKNQLCKIVIILSCLSTPVTARKIDNYSVRDVEIGAGGNIKLEAPDRTKLEERFEWHAHLLWESRYVTEGRDNLSGKGIYSLSTEFSYDDISLVPWIAEGINTDYSELNLNIIYGTKLLDNLEIFAAYNNIQARESGVSVSDNEISLDLVYFYDNRFKVLANIYYSFDADGAFAEVAIKKVYRINDDATINLRAVLGFNSGYITDGHNGLNHGQLRANFSYQIMKEIDVYAYTGYSLAINRDSTRYTGDELLRDLLWGGVGLSYRF